uniref:DUF834 domain-containing protein n=1 Tax=Oryza barthii TaxID=65489 RepID=A0A0D3HL24_9ORYZ
MVGGSTGGGAGGGGGVGDGGLEQEAAAAMAAVVQGERGGGGGSAYGGWERRRAVWLAAAEQSGDVGRRRWRRSGDGLEWEREGKVREVGIAVVLPPVLSLLVEGRRRYGGGKLEVSSGDSSVDRPHVRACERVACAAGTSWPRACASMVRDQRVTTLGDTGPGSA